MRYWWVNQNQTYKYEVPRGFLWSPKLNVKGHRNRFWDTMEKVSPGDMVFSFCDRFIKAIGIVQTKAESSEKPDFGNVANPWQSSGWLVGVEFRELDNPFRPKDFMEQIRPFLPQKYGPLQENGDGRQRYLMEISGELAELLCVLARADVLGIQNELGPEIDVDSEYEVALEIEFRKLQGEPEKIQLAKSRRGQGVFKSNVRMYENHCRVTGVSNIRHLRASHIKPWAKSNDDEKVDGANGLLLSPHVDHLFDRGFITFEGSGAILVSGKLNPSVLDRWGIEIPANVGNFHKLQREYLDYHRERIFQV